MTFAQLGSVLGYLLSPIYYSIYPSAHVDISFLAGTRGSVAEARFQVLDKADYGVYLDLYFEYGNTADRNRVASLSGTGQYSGIGPEARQLNTGLRIPVRVKIDRLDTATQANIVNGVFQNHNLESGGVVFYRKAVTGAVLLPGSYRLMIEALQDIPELNQTSIHVELQPSRRK